MPNKQLKWNKDNIRELLDKNDMAVKVAIVRIYERQTQEEKEKKETIDHNGVGFGAVDAKYLSYLAIKALKNTRYNPKEMAIGRNKIKKYAQQLADIANYKEEQKLGGAVNVL